MDDVAFDDVATTDFDVSAVSIDVARKVRISIEECNTIFGIKKIEILTFGSAALLLFAPEK